MKALLTWLLPLALTLTACVEKETTVRLKVGVKTNQGDPIAAAVIAIDGKPLGETNNTGAFAAEINLPTGAKKRLEVKKDSDTYYFAPYYEGFVVGDGAAQELSFAATLYFVPKPTADGGAKPVDKPIATVPATDPAKAAPSVAAAGDAAAAGAKPADPLDLAAAASASLAGAVAPEGGQPATGVTAAQAEEAKPSEPADMQAAAKAPGPDAAGATADAASIAAANAAAPGATAANAALPPAAEQPIGPAAIDPKAGAESPDAAAAPAAQPEQAPVTASKALAESVPESLAEDSPAAPITAEAAAAALDEDLAAIPAAAPAHGLKKHPTPLLPASEATPSAPSDYPKSGRVNQGQIVFTVHVLAGEQPVQDAEVLLGEEHATDLKSGCKTNARGRCVVRFPVPPEADVVFVASKKGFKTASLTTSVKDKGALKISLEHGHTLDIYALTRSYNHVVGLKNVEVYVAGKRAGLTDRFGRYSHVYDGKPDDLVAISLKPQGYLPETYETDFVASGPMTLVKYFTPDQPPAVRMTVLPAAPAGTSGKEVLKGLDASFDEALLAAARRSLFSSSAFKEFDLSLYEKAVHQSGRSPADILRSGWQDTDLKAVVDAVLVPTVVLGQKPVLELSAVDSTGHVLAAAKEELDNLADKGSVDRAVAVLAKKIARAFPFEGAVLGKDAGSVTINLGQAAGRGVKVGDVLDVYGVQVEKLGRSQLHGKVASLTVREVADQQAKCAVGQLAARATVERGDLVVLKARKAPEGSAAQLKVVAETGAKAVPQANVYFNDYWVGATDDSGRVYLDVTGSGTLRIIKQGFAEYAKPVAVNKKTKLDIALKRESAFLRVDSKPSGANVKIDGKIIGKTPLTSPVAVPAGFVKLELEAPLGYKPYTQVLELDQGTLDLTGEAAVALEPDLLQTARTQLKAGKTDEALKTLGSIPKEHSDYLLSRHEAGEIYLTVLDQPAKAAEAFAQVTANEAVKEFADKRFIGSHINEGIALFLTAEKLAAEKPEAARAHYQKALEVLDAVVPHLRFVPPAQYAQAVHNVDYHRALCRHRLWVASQDPRLLSDAVKTWKSYLDGSARSVPAAGASKTYIENAQIYYKQAMASLTAARNVSKQ